MPLEQKLKLQLSQRLVMTPSLQQAIKLLQMTRLELQNVLEQELVENPVLEENEEPEVTEEPLQPEETRPATAENGKEEALDHRESIAEVDLESYFGDWEDMPSPPHGPEDRELPPLENVLTREDDLYDYLLWQLHMSDVPERQRQLAELIIGNLTPDGFLVATAEEIRTLAGSGAEGAYTSEDVEKALAVVRSLDPPGIACADLRESLLLQLERRGERDSLAWRVVSEHWDAFLRRQFPAIAKAIGVDLALLEPAVELIRTLDLRPGRRFSTERTHYVEPDVAIVKVGDDYVIQLNDDGLPRLRISRAYRRMLQQMREEGKQSEAQQYIRDKMRSAIWLIKSLDQRQRTIYKVADSIVRQQREFLDRGIEYLRPMVLRDVAEDIGMHESTVSRVVSNKYMHTPRGLFPFKFFFHSGIDREYGEDISSLTVKRRIEQLVQAEDAKNPLSDSELMRMLHREGIHIARRTVAKYRDELNIPSSTDRKQIF